MAEELSKKALKKEKLGNCGGCSKPVKKIKRYYRGGKYYCTKRCYKNFLAKAKDKEKDGA